MSTLTPGRPFAPGRHGFSSLRAGGLNWDVVQERMAELMPLALGMIDWVNKQFEVQPYGLDDQEFIAYAADRAQRRLGAIESARGRPVEEIDLDYSPEALEEKFGEEDAKAMSEAAG